MLRASPAAPYLPTEDGADAASFFAASEKVAILLQPAHSAEELTQKMSRLPSKAYAVRRIPPVKLQTVTLTLRRRR